MGPGPNNSLTITDNRTGKTFELPIRYGTYPTYGAAINASELRQIKVSEEDFGLITYDPGFTNTASCTSSITFVDGERGILRYRGYPIAELADKSTYLETAYLLLNGELPDEREHQCTRCLGRGACQRRAIRRRTARRMPPLR